MANKSLFRSLVGKLLPAADSRNEAGALAYRMSDKHMLAQYAATGCLNNTFYAAGEEQLQIVLQLCRKVEPEFIAQTALYARTQSSMKDMPALLLAILSVESPGLMAEVFDRVIDSPKMLRNFVQIMRSGVVGRKSLGTLPKRLIQQWLENRTDEQLFFGSIGNEPSLADIVRMTHPKPNSPQRRALLAYLVGREYDRGALAEVVQQYEKFKRNTNAGKVAVPDVPFQLLTSLPLSKRDWARIARNASWQTTRMNLNTFGRHGVWEDEEVVRLVADRLRNPRAVAQARVFPYQLLAAYMNVDSGVPGVIREALQDAMELAISNVPRLEGQVYVFVDVSGSMHSPVTGHRPGATSKIRCIDVAALVAAAVLRRNPLAEVIPFESKVVECRLNPRDSVLTNAARLSQLPAGGTNCSAPLAHLNQRKARGELLIYVSDNESWVDSHVHGRFGGSATETMRQWNQFKARNPEAKLVCIDQQPYGTMQTKPRPDNVNVAGFSDQVFSLLGAVARGGTGEEFWVREIERTTI